MVVTKAALNKNQAEALLHDLFKNFSHWIQQPKDPTLHEVEGIFTKDFKLTSNGVLTSKNLSDHLNRLGQLRKKYARITVEGPFEDPLICDNKITVYYALNLKPHKGQDSKVDIMAIATVDENKFHTWTQVAHERGKDWHHQ